MSAHTPGPWTMRPDTGLAIFGADGEWLMSVHRPVEELRANACLIAAAPEMFAALHAAVEYAPHGAECNGGDDCACWKRYAAAAIAKAEGTP
jgi:hypothetical protein